MIRSLHIKNFRGFTAGEWRAEFFADSCLPASVVSVTGGASSGKSTIVMALEYLQAVARGKLGVDQMHGGEVAAVSQNIEQPCVISIQFDAGGEFFQYGLQLAFSARMNLWLVSYEWLQSSQTSIESAGQIFERNGSQVTVGSSDGPSGVYELDQRMFVLSTFVAPNQWHPVCRARRFLAGLFVVSGQMRFLDDRVRSEMGVSYLWPRGGNLGAWVVSQMSGRVDLYPALAMCLGVHLTGFRRLDVLDDKHTGKHLALVFSPSSASSGERIVPIGALSGTERLSFIGCLMQTVGQVFPDAVCIWDDFDDFAEKVPSLATSLGLAYAKRGQLIAFQRRNRKLFAKCMISLLKGKMK